ncbi:MAG: LamG-like jellyroll fold domain-containing protein [Bacteroidales bacterium]|jgi:hypothetical protein|nr:LamG-like jellyroll fold domain-containing protein [Bacteroidales bacterium]
MKKIKLSTLLYSLVITMLLASLMSACTKDDENNNDDSIYAVYMDENDEDYINFGTFEGFTAGTDWSVIEKIKMPAGADNDGGWHFFRGKAWEDKEGDIAISISETRVHAWCSAPVPGKAFTGWVSIIHEDTFNADQWYTICFQYNSTGQQLELYIDGTLVGQEDMLPMDDSNNSNNMFWGGQECAPVHNEGEMYTETSIIMFHQAWLQRTLSSSEIAAYDGYIAPESALFFATDIDASSVSDISGNNLNGTNGNSPEFIIIE